MKAHLAYLKYVIRHKWFVFLACRATGAPLWRSIIHDWTKFLPCEWFAYANFFYGRCPADSDEICQRAIRVLGQARADFDMAWNHHQKVNPHHWQYWVLITDSDEPRYRALQMPDACVREMVADWAGAGRAITGKNEVCAWYAKNKDKMILHENTRSHVEDILLLAFQETIWPETVKA